MANSPLQPYDFVMLAVLALSTAFGAWKGMAWQLASLASLVASGAVAVRFGKMLAPCFGAQEPWNLFLATLVLFVATSLAIWLLFRLVSGILDRVKLKQLDLQLGAVLGAAKGVLWCLVITFFAVTLSESTRRAVLPSRSGYYIARLIHRGGPVLPKEVRAVLGKYLDELDRQLDPRQGSPNRPVGARGTRSREIHLVGQAVPDRLACQAQPDLREKVAAAMAGC